MTALEDFGAWLENYVNNVRQPLLDKITEAENTITDLRSKYDALNSENQKNMAEVTTLSNTISQLRGTITALEQRIAELEASLPTPRTPKEAGGLVVVDPSKLAVMSKYGVNQYVQKISWAQLEPTKGNFNWSVIDNLLNAQGQNKTKLRIQSGGTAPQWLKDATGTVEVYNASRGITVQVCHWWEDVAMDAWASMIKAVGERYDGDPRVVVVSADAPMVVYSEPYILGNDKASGMRLFAAGCNQQTHTNAIRRCVADTAKAFPNTLVELAIHGDLQSATATGISTSIEAGRDLALELALKHGRQLVLSDYGLGTVDSLENHRPTGTIETERDIYAWMHLRANGGDAPWAGPVSFQLTVGKEPQTQETYRKAAQNAIDLGGIDVETAGWGLLSNLAEGLDKALKTNAAKWAF